MILPSLPPLAIPKSLARLAVGLWAVLVAAIVFFSLSPDYGPPGAFQLDKAAHFLGYGAAAGLPFLGFRARRAVLAAALAMLPLGVGLELLQELVPTRATDAMDALANLAGVVLGIALGPFARRLANRWLQDASGGTG